MFKISKKVVLIFIICIFAVCGCKSSDISDNKFYEGDSAEDVKMVIKEGTLTKTSATIIITDNSDNYKTNAYNVAYGLYKKQDDKWVPLELIPDEIATTLVNYFVDEDSHQLEMQCKWEGAYGILSNGKYKIVKHFNNLENNQSYTFSTDFIIE